MTDNRRSTASRKVQPRRSGPKARRSAEIIRIAQDDNVGGGGTDEVTLESVQGEEPRRPATGLFGQTQPNAALFFPWLAFLAKGTEPDALFTQPPAFCPWWPVVEHSDHKEAPRGVVNHHIHAGLSSGFCCS